MDKRKKYIMVLDTETAPIEQTREVSGNNALVYDIGFLVTDKSGKVYTRGSYILGDIFFKENEKMNSAYYNDKIPAYLKEIENGDRIVVTAERVAEIIREVIQEYNVTVVSAHNAIFDFLALKKTQEYLRLKNSIVPYIEWWDTLKMSKVIADQKMYQEFCRKNGYMTKHKTPRVRQSAEILYKYISHDNDFIESHTALEDCEIEKEILIKCLRQHKKMEKRLFKGK